MPESSGREGHDYMGDLSRFLPPDEVVMPTVLQKAAPVGGKNQKLSLSLKGKPKNRNWQETRKIERERKQIEEDAQTLDKIEKAPIPQSIIGFKLLKQMGYTPGSVLGKEGSGIAEPMGIEIRRSRAGIGREDPHKEKMKLEEMMTEKNGGWKNLLWRNLGLERKSIGKFEESLGIMRKQKRHLIIWKISQLR